MPTRKAGTPRVARATVARATRAGVLTLVLALVPAAARGAAGDLDPSFGIGGERLTPYLQFVEVAIDDAGRALVAGTSMNDHFGPTVSRYTASGALDGTFGDRGHVTLDSEILRIVTSLAVSADGRPLVALRSYETVEGRSAEVETVRRITPDGSVDPSFGMDGAVRIVSYEPLRFGGSLFANPDGGAQLVGFLCDNETCSIRGETFDGNGTPHASFVTDRDLASPLTGSIVRDGDGRIVVAALPFDLGDGPFPLVLARYLPNGTPDETFGRGGRTVGTLAISKRWPCVLAMDPGGTIVLAAADGADEGFVARFSSDGTLDPDFGVGGVTPLRSDAGIARPVDVAVAPDGRIVVVGQVWASGHDWFVGALDARGAVADFGRNGFTIRTPTEHEDAATNVRLLPSGRPLVVGSVGPNVVLARYEGFPRACGDADGNGAVTVTDGVQVLRAAADLTSACLAPFCDVDGTGSVTVTDGVLTLQSAAGLSTRLQCAAAR